MKVVLDFEEQSAVQRLGLALRAARIKAEQTQDELAARIGVTRWTVAAMEKGDPKVSLAAWLKASNLLNFLGSWEDVLQEAEDPFSKYDREQADKNNLLKTRIRQRNAPTNS